jgi:hypothetical protein
MNANKITQLHVYLIGAVVMLIVGVGLYFLMLKPLYDSNAALDAEVQSLEAQTVTVDGQAVRWNEEPKAQAAVAVATQRQQTKRARLAKLEKSKDLPPQARIDLGSGTDREVLQRTMGRWLALPERVVRMMEGFAYRQGGRHGVLVATEFAAPAPTTVPGQIPRDIIAWNLGPMSATGSFPRVMRWAQSWNNAPLLVSVDGLKCSLAGRGGTVTATATLTVFIFPKGQAVTNPGASPGPGAPAPGAGNGPGGMNGPSAGQPAM